MAAAARGKIVARQNAYRIGRRRAWPPRRGSGDAHAAREHGAAALGRAGGGGFRSSCSVEQPERFFVSGLFGRRARKSGMAWCKRVRFVSEGRFEGRRYSADNEKSSRECTNEAHRRRTAASARSSDGTCAAIRDNRARCTCAGVLSTVDAGPTRSAGAP